MPSTTRIRSIGTLALVFFLFAFSVRPAQAQEPLSFFKNYFITGDYVVRGTSLWRKGIKGVATSNIVISGVDEDNVDVLAAFLYVQTAEKEQWSGIDHAKFRGNDLGPGDNSFAKALNWEKNTTPCWSLIRRGPRRIVTYRADVLRFLPVKVNGKIGINGSHQVRVPDGGHFYDKGYDDEDDWETATEIGPRAVGASLVIVYRDPRQRLKSIVIYDGGQTKRAFDSMLQPIKGFYQASSSNPVTKMTHIVGDGSRLLSEKVFLNGTQLLPVNPVTGAEGYKWDDPTFTNLNLTPNADSAVVKVDRNGLLSDCLVYSAIVFSTTVQDTDGDGLLDVWERSATTLYDPNNQPLPNLNAMGADPNVKDIFAEIAYMTAAPGTSYGGVVKPAHSHLPPEASLNMAGDAFANAPTPVRVHFDVGGNYQHDPPNPYIIPASLARGGKFISETLACPDPVTGQLKECASDQMPGQYPRHPGTVGWKTGFRFLRDELLGFDRNRKDMFRYVLFAHSLGIPVEPCLKADGTADFVCQDTNPLFHIPVTNSGIADFPGGDLLVTLGHFDTADDVPLPVGSPFMQGSTIMHEWGHTFELTHAGTPVNPPEPNCKSNYLSVMNYLFQLRGLPDSGGTPRMDYSREVVKLIDEFSLIEDPLGSQLFRTGWYLPKSTTSAGKAALKHCDGSALSQLEQDDLNRPDGQGGMVRVDAANVLGPIDWNGNGVLFQTGFSQDVNFDGTIAGDATHSVLKASPNDWLTIRPNQLGSRRNVGGYYIDTLGRNAVGPMSLDVGRGDIGRGDIGRGDIGRGDIGRGDIGRGDIGRGDIGGGNIGRGDIGRGDIGRGDIGRGLFGGGDTQVGGVNEPFSELSLETALAAEGIPAPPPNSPTPPPPISPTPPTALQACLTTGADYVCASEGGGVPVRLHWDAPHLGRAVRYFVYRFTYPGEAFVPPANLPNAPIATIVPEDGLILDYLDFEAPPGSNVAYFVRAQGSDGQISGISNFATVTTPPIRLAFVTQPATSAAGRTMPPVRVAVLDPAGQAMTVTGVPITLAIGTNPSEGTLSGTTTQQTVNGVATFANLSIDRAGGYTLVAMSGTFVGATSDPFTVVAAPVIVTGSLPDGTQHAPYSQAVAAQGGLPPYSWDIKPVPESTEFTLPDGLTLATQEDGTGLIAGAPTTVQVRSFRLRVTDASGQTATQDLCIHIEESREGPLVAVPRDASGAAAIAQLLVGEGQAITISNALFSGFAPAGATSALGTFSGGFEAVGLSSGVILGTGSVSSVNPPNDSDFATTENLVPGDSDLQGLIAPGVGTFDAAVLEFDFTVTNPAATMVKFDYVFASEEYSEFVNSDFNDVFGFFMSGPNFPKANLALVTNTTTPVSINTVNQGSTNPDFPPTATNPNQFINNQPPTRGTQADGLTRVFTISASITPNVTYHLKLAVADVADFQYDSWVMIKSGSFSALCPIIPSCPTCGK